MEAWAEAYGSEVFCDGRSRFGGKTSFEVGGSDWAAQDSNAAEVGFVVWNGGWEGVRGGAEFGEGVGGRKGGCFVGTGIWITDWLLETLQRLPITQRLPRSLQRTTLTD